MPLPDGATITKITALVLDNHAANSCFYLYSSLKEELAFVGCSSGASATPQTIEKTTSIVVDGTIAYYTYVEAHGEAGPSLVPIRMTFEYTLG